MITHTNRLAILKEIGNRLVPMWSLKNFVAVNQYFGLHDMHVEDADWYLSKINGSSLFKSHQPELNDTNTPIPSLSDYFSKLSDTAFNLKLIDYVSGWCAAYFDASQSLIPYPKSTEKDLFNCFLEDLKIDKSLSIFGLKSLKPTLSSIPTEYQKALEFILDHLQIEERVLPLYLHRVLMQYQGWASLIRKNVWQDELENKENDELLQFHTSLLVMEYLMFQQLSTEEKTKWRHLISQLSIKPSVTKSIHKHKAQNDYEESQRQLLFKTINNHTTKNLTTAEIQAVFCIDVRSEIFRRHLESQDDLIETIGFAGFFGAAFKFKSIGNHEATHQLPVLLSAKYTVTESLGSDEKDAAATQSITLLNDIKKAWMRFKMAGVSCFSFVGPLGIMYLPILMKSIFLGQSYQETKSSPLKWKGESAKITCSKHHGHGISIEDQVAIAQNALKGMSLSPISKLVALIGHESVSQNNPYESALDCGACGGHSGQKNAEIVASILNDADIRAALRDKGITIPQDSHFISGIHNTTTDVITFFNTDSIPQSHHSLFEKLKKSCEEASKNSRIERAERLSVTKDIHQEILNRSKDWSQVRPEWGLAGCHAFIASPRTVTRDVNLSGRVFLHSYDWKKDEGFGVLELILTAPVVVASWINLQYYASAIDNQNFGSGNKVLHNVVAGMGVLEGGYGDIRVGLPMQSLHDGTNFQHSLERLNVIIAAPHDAINAVLQKHSLVKNLVENRWIHLFSMDDTGKVSYQYDKDGQWNAVTPKEQEV